MLSRRWRLTLHLGPMVSPLCFSNLFRGLVKYNIFEMLQMLHQNKLDIARLNYGVLVLIPKIKGANQIKQFRPIWLLNVIYKIITKVLTLRLNIVINKIISEAQTAFIPGRYILDGVLIVHEILHELRVRKKKGIILKFDFEFWSNMDRVDPEGCARGESCNQLEWGDWSVFQEL